MPIKADTKYNGTVTAGSRIIETAQGTLGYQVNLECEDGATNYVIWLTEKNRDRARKSFEVLGIPAAKLQDANFLEYELDTAIEGREVSFGTREDEYKGKTTIKVAWIGRKSESLDGGVTRAFAGFFAGSEQEPKREPEKLSPKRSADDIDDDHIPF